MTARSLRHGARRPHFDAAELAAALERLALHRGCYADVALLERALGVKVDRSKICAPGSRNVIKVEEASSTDAEVAAEIRQGFDEAFAIEKRRQAEGLPDSPGPMELAGYSLVCLWNDGHISRHARGPATPLVHAVAGTAKWIADGVKVATAPVAGHG